MTVHEPEQQSRAERIEALVQEIETIPDAHVRAQMEELVQSLLDLYGDGLARILELTAEANTAGAALIETFASDDLVKSLLLLHGLHPDDIETRIAGALDDVRPYLKSHGGNVELLGVADGVARLRLQGSCNGCPSSTITLKLAIEEAIYAAAPDLDGLEVEGVTEPPPNLITLTPTRRKASPTPSPPQAAAKQSGAWSAVEGVAPLAEGTLHAATIQEQALVFCRVGETYYAYRDRCGKCTEALDTGTLAGAILTCASCGQRYDVSRAGRSVENPTLLIEPVPLLAEGATLKVALPTLAATR